VLDSANGDIYVANFGNGTVSVISSTTNTVVAVLSVGNSSSSPLPPVFDPANGELYVAISGGDAVAVISGETVVSTVRVGGTPSTPFFDPQNTGIYVPFYSSADFVSVISGATNTVIANITTGAQDFVGRAFDPTNGDIYLTSNSEGTVSIISGETNTLVGSIALSFATYCNPFDENLPNIPCSQAQDGPSAPVFDPANGDIYVSNGGGDTVSVISGGTNSLVTNVDVGSGPGTPVIDPANGDIYVLGEEGNTVSVISSATNAVIATATVGDQPFQAVFNPMNGDIYVPSLTQDGCGAGVCLINSTLSIISGATNAVVATVPLCMDPTGTTVDSSNGDVYVSCSGGTVWVISSTTVESSTTTTSTRLGEILPDCGAPFNTLLNPAPKGTVYMKVVTDQGAVVTNGTLVVSQVDPAGGLNYCISMSDVNGTGYLQLAPVNFNGTHTDFITSSYYNVTLWAGYDNPNVTNNPGPSFWATIPSIQVNPNSTIYVTVSIPSGVVTVVTSNERSSIVTTTTTSATTTKVNGP
jgi:YVTN family beta-propeller protein